MNNLEFTALSLNEDIDAAEAYRDEGVIITIVQGRKGAGMIALTPQIKELVIKNKLNLIKVIPEHHNIYVVYKDQREKALALWNYLKEHNGYLSDRTPEQAWEIGKLLDYSDDSIKKFIRRVYVDKVDAFGRKYSNDRVDDDMVVDPKFLEENEENISCQEYKITPEIAEYVSKFESSEKLLRSGGIPIELLDKAAYGFTDAEIKQLMPKRLSIKWKEDLENVIYEQEKSGLSKIAWARKIDLTEPIEVSYNGKKFFIEDGHHRYYAAKILNKPLNIDLDIHANPIKKLDGGKGDYDKLHRCIWNQVHNKENLDEYYNDEYGDDRYDDNGNYININIEKTPINSQIFIQLKQILEARKFKRFDQKIYNSIVRKLTKNTVGRNPFAIAMEIFEHLPKITWEEYQQNGVGLNNIEEGVGDKYAEKKFGIPDQDTIFNDLYKSSKEKESNEPVAIAYAKVGRDARENSPIEIYKNPKSLTNFSPNVRAIGDNRGNLYVAIVDARINHDKLGEVLGFGDQISEDETNYVCLHRVKETNSFGLSDMSDMAYNGNYQDETIDLLKKVKRVNPQYSYYTTYYGLYSMGDPIEEGVGDKYFEKKTGANPEFADFEQKYKEKKIKDEQENIVYQDKNLTIIANPKSLKNIGRNVRGIIDRNGNLYVEAQSYTTHDDMIIKLSQKGLIKHIDDWHLVLPTDFITVIRYGDTNKFYLGESNESMTPDDDRFDDSRKYLGKWYTVPSYMQSYKIFQAFLNNAKQKNPKIEFINEMVRYTFGINENKEKMNENELISLNDLPFKNDIDQLGGKIFSVGGAVRDGFLGKESKDLDILITGVPIDKLEQILSNYGRVDSVGKSFGIIKFKANGSDPNDEPIDIAIPRTERATGDGGHKDFEITSDHELPIEKDLERRDFTINAIAKDNDGNLIDPYGGQEDLKNKIIRAVNPEAFSDDPLRMLRAVQFASRFGFTIEPNTMNMIVNSAEMIKKEPAERLLTEFDKIIKKGNIRVGVQLLKDTKLFENIFGFELKQSVIDRSPFEEVKTMGEFVFLMIRLLPNPSEFYLKRFGTEDAKRNKNYKDIKALDLGFNYQGSSPIEARSIAHNMFITNPNTIESLILPEVVGAACQELLSGKYPKTVNELALNGQDLMNLGLKGKEIGDAQKRFLINIYADKVANTPEDLTNFLNKGNMEEGVGDKYAEKKFNIPDSDKEFEKDFKSYKQNEIEKPFGYVDLSNGKRVEVYKNPKSLNNFDDDVRAIGDVRGNLYVAVKNNGFLHGHMAKNIGLGSTLHDIYVKPSEFVLLHRIDNTNDFGFADSTSNQYYVPSTNKPLSYYKNAINNILKNIKAKNPSFKFYPKYFTSYEPVDPIEEGVGDKYAEKKFNIPNEEDKFERVYQSELQKNMENPFGTILSKISYDDKLLSNIPVYKNPKSLAKFDRSVRGIIDSNGNLYLSFIDGNFNHGYMAKEIGFAKNDTRIYDEPKSYVLVLRIGTTNSFGLSDSSDDASINYSREILEILQKCKKINPQFNFFDTYYLNVRSNNQPISVDNNTQENLDETIKGGEYTMYHGTDHDITNFTDEFVGGENANDQEGPGIYFTSSIENAGRFGKNVYKVILKPRKLANIAPKNVVSTAIVTGLIKASPSINVNNEDALSNWGMNPAIALRKAVASIMQYAENEKDLFQQIWIDFYRNYPVEFVRNMVKIGYDGELLERVDDVTHIIIYNPNSITSIEKLEDEQELNSTDKMNESFQSDLKAFKAEKELQRQMKPSDLPKDDSGKYIMKDISYTGIVLNERSKAKIIEAFKDKIPKGYRIVADHMTICLGKLPENEREEHLGITKQLTVVSFAMNDKVAAVGVTGFPSNNEYPHVTLAVNDENGGKAMMSNYLTNWEKALRITISGVVTEVPYTI